MPPWAPARLTVLAGPSGVGKGTVASLIAKRFERVFLSISATTRPPRSGEADGVNYHFVNPKRFEEMVSSGQMLEWAKYSGHLYGTPRNGVEQALSQNRPALLEIDLAGARQVRASMPDAVQIFLAPPTFAELARRLQGRGTENQAQRAARLEVARAELAASNEFDVVVINDRVEQAASEVARVMGLDWDAHPTTNH
ncbi:MAG: guanylate kinase [Micrococcales bacterium]|nr:guanylate kinase [Micrococcales bacterium]